MEEIIRIVKAAIDGGINWFDTAELYGNGASESSLAHALKKLEMKQENTHIATKWWPLFRTARSIRTTIDKRRTALDGWPITLYQIHQPFSFSSIEAQVHAMADLVDNGNIGSVGVSNFSASQMAMAHRALQKRGHLLVSNQIRYNLLNRRIEKNGTLLRAADLGISIIAYSPLAQGLLTGKYHDDRSLIKKRAGLRRWFPSFSNRSLKRTLPVVISLKTISERLNATPAQVALAWLINKRNVSVFAIPGATKKTHVENNVAAMRLMLNDNDIRQLDDISAPFIDNPIA